MLPFIRTFLAIDFIFYYVKLILFIFKAWNKFYFSPFNIASPAHNQRRMRSFLTTIDKQCSVGAFYLRICSGYNPYAVEICQSFFNGGVLKEAVCGFAKELVWTVLTLCAIDIDSLTRFYAFLISMKG